MSFTCDTCGFYSTEANFSGTLQEKGCRHELKVATSEDLSRQVIKSDSATIIIPEIEFEIPPLTQRGSITTIEGVLKKSIDHLREDQDERTDKLPEVAAKITDLLTKMTMYAHGITLPFTFIVDDPAGNRDRGRAVTWT